jgi:predicted CXXCH cytochrome family protein
MSCHKPHGSNHRQLLVTTVALLCQQCHSTD